MREAGGARAWRVDNVKGMNGLRFRRKPYASYSEQWTHDHCTACDATFAEVDGPEIQREGYATCEDWKHGPDYDWICISCFADLRDAMDWVEVTGGEKQPLSRTAGEGAERSEAGEGRER